MTSQTLRDYLDQLSVISVHEHHQEDAWHRDLDLDKLLLSSYVGWINPSKGGSITDRQAFLDQVRHNAYFVWLERGLQWIYDIERITPENWDDVSAVIRQSHNASVNWHLEVLREHGFYLRAIQDAYWNPGSHLGHPELFSPTFRINTFVMCHHPEMTDHNGNSPWRYPVMPPRDLTDYLALIDRTVAGQKAAGAVALKSALAYDRDIAFQPREQREVEHVFGKHPSEVSPEEQRAYQDFMFEYFCTLAAKYDLTFQNHTGLAKIGGSNPMNLEPMIVRHQETKFVLFHGGYPWVHEVAGLAHNYANVYPDLTWLPLISTTAAIQAVCEWLEAAWSSTKICWGGDTWTGEESVGAALALKHVLTVALSQLVDEGYFDLDDALCIARRICYENAIQLYGLPVVIEQTV